MSQGDEYQEGEPPRPKGGWRDQNAAPDDREDFGDLPKPPPQRSGLVMTVGILAIIFGSLGLICGVCVGIGGGVLAGGTPFMQDIMKQAAAKDPKLANDPNIAKAMKELDTKGQSAGWLAVGEGVFNILRGLLLLIGGIGVLMRSNICRYVVLAACVIGVLGALADFGIATGLGLMDVQAGTTSCIGMTMGLAFTGFAFYVLLNPKHTKEFAR